MYSDRYIIYTQASNQLTGVGITRFEISTHYLDVTGARCVLPNHYLPARLSRSMNPQIKA